MRIAFHAPRAAYFKSYTSGDTANVRNFISGLERLGHEVRVVSRTNVRRVWQRRLSLRQLAAEVLRVRREMRVFAPDAWLVYNSSTTDADLFGWWLCRGRYVLINTRVGRGHRLPRRWRRIFSYCHRRAIRRADSLSADRPAHVEALIAAGARRDAVYMLPSPAGGLGHIPTQEEARARLSLPHASPVVLCVTRLPPLGWGARKTERVIELVRSFAELEARCRLVLVGGGEGQKHVEAEIQRNGVEGRVLLAGTVPHSEVRWYYAASDFYAFPFPEDLPFVAIVEAQSAGRPVVVMDTPASRTIVLDGRTGLLARDLQEFTAHMTALAADRARCVTMGHAARDYIHEHHSSERRVQQIEALLAGRTNDPATERGLRTLHAAR